MKTTNRAELLRVASLVRPALASADYIPALTHIMFDGGRATAFNDINALSVGTDVAISRCVPGELLIRSLGSFGGESVALTYDDKTHVLLLASGRSKVKLPTLPAADFPFDSSFGDEGAGAAIPFTREMVRAVERCLVSAGTNPKNPAQVGVTLEADGGCAVFYSTDSATISRAATTDPVSLPADAPVIMPTFLCEQLVSLSKAFPGTEAALVALPGALLVDFLDGDGGVQAWAYSKVPVDVEPIDFGRVVKRFCNPAAARKSLVKIPDALDAAFGRALMVLSHEPVKTTRVSVSGGAMSLYSTSAMGDADDEVAFEHPDVREFRVDPSLLVRGLKQCERISAGEKVLILGDDTGAFLHLVSHVTD